MKKPEPPFEVNFVKNVFIESKHYCHLAGDHDYVSVTEWKNGEGFDVNINRKSSELCFNISHGEFDTLLKAIRQLGKRDRKTAKVIHRAYDLLYSEKIQVHRDRCPIPPPIDPGEIPF